MELILIGRIVAGTSFVLFYFAVKACKNNTSYRILIVALTYITAYAAFFLIGIDAVKHAEKGLAVFCFSVSILWPFLWWTYLSPLQTLENSRQNTRRK